MLPALIKTVLITSSEFFLIPSKDVSDTIQSLTQCTERTTFPAWIWTCFFLWHTILPRKVMRTIRCIFYTVLTAAMVPIYSGCTSVKINASGTFRTSLDQMVYIRTSACTFEAETPASAPSPILHVSPFRIVLKTPLRKSISFPMASKVWIETTLSFSRMPRRKFYRIGRTFAS